METPATEPSVVQARIARRRTGETGGDGAESAEGKLCDLDSNPSYQSEADIVPLDKKDHLDLIATTALVINKIIGTGIYLSPKVVLGATGSKGVSLMIWIAGCIMTWAGLLLYLEYGIRWPITGGELYYVDNVIKKPKELKDIVVNNVIQKRKRLPGPVTYIFSAMFILLNGVQSNTLQMGQEIIIANSPTDTNVNDKLEKFFAIMIITFVCQLLAYSRSIYIRIGNILALLKVISLVFISLCGVAALAKARVNAADEIHTAYGTSDFSNAFASASNSPYQYGLALLSVIRAFQGYENANFVLTEIRGGVNGDKTLIFRRAIKISVATTCVLYITVNLAFFAVCTTDEIIYAPDTTTIFLQKIFGITTGATVGAAVMIAFSAGGAVMGLTFAISKVKQEMARLGMVPVPEFWSKSSHRRTPAHALLLHWIFSVICIIITPLYNPAGFLIMSTLYSYVKTYISILLGACILGAPWISAFQFPENDPPDRAWEPKSSSWGWWLLTPLISLYICLNSFVLVLTWFPANLQETTHTTTENLPYYTGPVVGLGIIGFGILWWGWDNHILPWLGYEFWRVEEDVRSQKWQRDILSIVFHRKLTGTAARVNEFCKPGFLWIRKVVSRDQLEPV